MPSNLSHLGDQSAVGIKSYEMMSASTPLSDQYASAMATRHESAFGHSKKADLNIIKKARVQRLQIKKIANTG